MGTDVEEVNAYTAPANNKFNSIAVADVNNAITVGENVNSYGWVGRVTA
jgi:hypothetical protein